MRIQKDLPIGKDDWEEYIEYTKQTRIKDITKLIYAIRDDKYISIDKKYFSPWVYGWLHRVHLINSGDYTMFNIKFCKFNKYCKKLSEKERKMLVNIFLSKIKPGILKNMNKLEQAIKNDELYKIKFSYIGG